MKKFLTVAIILGILGFGTYYAAMYKGFYIDFHPDTPAEASFTAEGKKLVWHHGDEASEFVMQGGGYYVQYARTRGYGFCGGYGGLSEMV